MHTSLLISFSYLRKTLPSCAKTILIIDMVVSREDIPRNDHLSVFHPRNFPVVEVVKGGHFAVAGIVDRGQTHEGTGEEAAVRLVHVVVGEDPRVEPDRQFGPGLTVERAPPLKIECSVQLSYVYP